jgi:hypothetical protein
MLFFLLKELTLMGTFTQDMVTLLRLTLHFHNLIKKQRSTCAMREYILVFILLIYWERYSTICFNLSMDDMLWIFVMRVVDPTKWLSKNYPNMISVSRVIYGEG